MMILVSYDVSTKTPAGVTRLRKIAETCVDHGIRVQNSVFECQVEPDQWERFKDALLRLYKAEEDSLRFYRLQEPRDAHVEEHGVNKTVFFDDPLII